jgi:hypothetical protein
MKCKYPGCEEGHYCYGYRPAEHVTKDMAIDAGDRNLEGSLYSQEEYDWGACPCCGGGDYENCPNCSKEEDKNER